MCVINAAILFFLLADLDGRGERGGDGRCGRVSLLDAVCEASGVGASAGEVHGGARREGEARSLGGEARGGARRRTS